MASPPCSRRTVRCADKGISHQIAVIGSAVGEALRRLKKADAARVTERLRSHPSDTVRAWAVFALTRANPGLSREERLEAARPFAADTHFGVREWAWMAVRPWFAAETVPVIGLLQDWTASPDPNIRRFAVESTRPRGVWCEHIARLKTTPGVALPLLEPLKADPARYVQDSVANWLNDASKSATAWVLEYCDDETGLHYNLNRYYDPASGRVYQQGPHWA